MTAPKKGIQRREFLTTSTTAGVAAAAALSHVPFVHAQGTDVIKIGLVGCGGRGTGAAAQALKADPNVRLVAMGDAFPDKLRASLANLRNDPSLAPKIDVPNERQFTGIDAYTKVIEQCDVVLLTSPPHFRPTHIEAAVRAGKHIFAEKPMAVDGPGVRRVLAAVEQAKQKKLALVAGFCWRYHKGLRETVKQVHDGKIGNVVAIQSTYNASGLWSVERREGMGDVEWQMRNWLYFTWLSGDFNVEQHIHSLDKAMWIMRNEPPVRAWGTGGRQVRVDPKFGHIFDHMAVVFEFANGTRCYSFCRQQDGCKNDVSDIILGTEGQASLIRHQVTGRNAWTYRPMGRDVDMYQQEHNELFKSIRDGDPKMDGDWMMKSTLMGIMGRMAAYTGQEVTWQAAMNSQEDLTPPSYDMTARLPVAPVARPGATPLR